MRRLGLVFLLTYLYLSIVQAAQKVVIELTEGICGDCCVMKAMSPKGVLTLENVKVGDPKVTFVYDQKRTTPEKILEDLKAVGKIGKVLEVIKPSENQTDRGKWVQPQNQTR